MLKNRVIYFADQKRIDLHDTNQDCESCKEIIDKEVENAKNQAREKVKLRKTV